MDDLTYELRQLCQRNRDSGHDTQAGRLGGLTLIARQLRELGFRQMHASSLKPKHVEALLTRWQAEGLAAGTQKNRMSYIRWWAEKVGKAGVIPRQVTRSWRFLIVCSSRTRTRPVFSMIVSRASPISMYA